MKPSNETGGGGNDRRVTSTSWAWNVDGTAKEWQTAGTWKHQPREGGALPGDKVQRQIQRGESTWNRTFHRWSHWGKMSNQEGITWWQSRKETLEASGRSHYLQMLHKGTARRKEAARQRRCGNNKNGKLSGLSKGLSSRSQLAVTRKSWQPSRKVLRVISKMANISQV